MTFVELCKQTKKEYGDKIPRYLVQDILVTAIRVALEELLANPADANITINSLFKIYMNRQEYDMPHYLKDKDCDRTQAWVIHLRAFKQLKAVINGRLDYKLLRIAGSIPLYPDYIKSIEGEGKRRRKGKPKKDGSFAILTEQTIDRYLERATKKEKTMKEDAIKSKLPEVEEDE